MTGVMFHFNVPDKRGYACRYLRKAITRTHKVAVTGDAALLQLLDVDLWTFSTTDFIAHCDSASAQPLLSASPVVLCDVPAASPHQDILLNLGMDVPEGFGRFERLVELVDTQDADRAASRKRWKHYRDRGYSISTYDVVTQESRQWPAGA